MQIGPAAIARVALLAGLVAVGAAPSRAVPNTTLDVYENNVLSLTAIRTHQVYPLDSIYTPAVRKDFNQNALGECTYKGHIYCVSMVIDTGGIYYRKSDAIGAQIKTGIAKLKSNGTLVRLAKKYKIPLKDVS